MRVLILLFFLAISVNVQCQDVNVKVKFNCIDSSFYMNYSDISASTFKLVDSLVYNKNTIRDIDILYNDIIYFNIYCNDPERYFLVSSLVDDLPDHEFYEVSRALQNCILYFIKL